jgi:DegV family protein with EDD domain
MQIVTDSGTDYQLSSLENENHENIHVVPLSVTLEGKTYADGVEGQRDEFFQRLEQSGELPITSQPSAGDFAKLYKKLAVKDADILSIHISSGLSGTVNAARAGVEMTPEAHVTVFDTKTLSIGAGWQVNAAARAIRNGWSRKKILERLNKISQECETLFTLKELKYLIHGGRISHMKGLIASVLQIKPVLGVAHDSGKYIQLGQFRSFQGALDGIVEMISKKMAPGSTIRAQLGHAANPEGAQLLQDLVSKVYQCHWLPTGPISYVLGAHTGPTIVGFCYVPESVFDGLQ